MKSLSTQRLQHRRSTWLFGQMHAAAERPELPAQSIPPTEEAFRAVVDTSTQNGAILQHLRQHFGQWQGIDVLEEISGSRRMNSRASDLRKIVDAEGLDIDQQSRFFEPTGRIHSCYRLIEKEKSERLRRIAERKEAS